MIGTILLPFSELMMLQPQITLSRTNAIENYYSTSLKGQSKKQLRTDSGINLYMKISSMKRFDMIGKPKSRFSRPS